MIGLYPSVDVYTARLRALEVYIAQAPQAADARFVLAYHYLTEGYPAQAVDQLREVVRLQPQQVVAAQLLQTLTPPAETAPSVPAPETAGVPPVVAPPVTEPAPAAQPTQDVAPVVPAAGAEPVAAPVQPEEPEADTPDNTWLVGTWKATRPDGTTFTLTLTADWKFTWNFSRAGKGATLTGTYSNADDQLTMEDAAQGTMVGDMTSDTDDTFNLKLLGAVGGGGDLVFHRQPAAAPR